ncbi:MAG TPA: hypothetical protein IAA59_06910 [Candidatus Faecaligallichristensenella faecipullorum]|nr:hypothetical protein [Candidatus Faecaligallichristensenella faecipullorum]
MKRILMLGLLVFGLCLGTCSVVLAQEITPYSSDLFQKANATLNVNGKVLTAQVKIVGRQRLDQVGVSSFAIQEYRNGTWVSVKVFKSGYNKNALTYTHTLTHNGKSGTKYRVRATCVAKLDGQTDTRVRLSSTKTIS